MYKEYKINFETSFNLQKMKIVHFRNIIANIRLSSHDLNIEQGRYRHIPRCDRKCTLCPLNETEDEFHFIRICPHYELLRKKYIKQFYFIQPIVHKYLELLNCDNVSVLNKFFIKSFELRKETLK